MRLSMKTNALFITFSLFLSKSKTIPLNEKIHKFCGFPDKKWPNDTVYYRIKDGEFETDHLAIIHAAMEKIQNVSCVRFQHDKNAMVAAYALFTGEDSGCSSDVGYDQGVRNINLNVNEGCVQFGYVLHEILHILGFDHTQSIYNRDEYINIHTENILEGNENNFEKYDKSKATDFGVPYDFASVMHYNEKEFAKPGTKTIEAKEDSKIYIGQRDHLSLGDIVQLNRMYECCDKEVNNKELIKELCDIKWD